MTERLIFAALGGAGEIGMNMYLYGWGAPDAEEFILVDMGVTFPSMDSTPGVDLIMPDVAWLAKRADRLRGVFITHAHEDHIGALGHLYARLGGPRVLTRAFTGAVARAKLGEHGVDVDQVEVLGPMPHMTDVGPFQVGFLPVPHSIPEASGLVIDTPAGRLVHTGDFKLDPDPVVGEPFDASAWAAVAKPGVHALICDSTNVFSPAPGRSEAGLAEDIGALIEGANGLVVATTFASNVARLKTLAQAAQAAGRSVCVLGRAMQRMLGYARGAGLIDDFPPVVDLEDAHEIPRDHLMLIVTGSQGERRAASAQLANGKYLGFRLQEGDLFLFSSKTIPGNEVGVSRVINQMSEMGVRVIDDSDGRYHVSGHANRPDLERAHGIFKPRIVVPMHGEHRHLRAHADLARAAGMESLVAPNGTVVDLTQNAPKVVDAIEAGRTYLDGSVLIGAFDGVVLDRVRMATRGTVVVALMVEDGALVGDPWAEALGMPEDANAHAALQDTIEAAIAGELGAMLAKGADDEAIERATVRAVHRVTKDQVGKKPVVRVLINHLT